MVAAFELKVTHTDSALLNTGLASNIFKVPRPLSARRGREGEGTTNQRQRPSERRHDGGQRGVLERLLHGALAQALDH